MGTTCVQAWGNETAKEVILRNFVEPKVPGEKSGFAFEYLAQKGSIFYGIMRREDAQSDDVKFFGIVIKTSSHTPKGGRREICYKEMTEEMGPFFYDASLKMLDMLDRLAPDPGVNAAAWRAKCREVHRENALKNAIPWQGGDKVEYGGNIYKLLTPAAQKPGWRVQCEKTGQIYRMPPAHLRKSVRQETKIELAPAVKAQENLDLFEVA